MKHSLRSSAIQINELAYQAFSDVGQYGVVQLALARVVTPAVLSGYLSSLVSQSACRDAKSAGRGVVLRETIEGREVIIRLYRRGGLAQYLFRHSFFSPPWRSLAHTRAMQEFCLNAVLSTAGCAVPTPIAAFSRRSAGLWWEGLIMTEALAGKNLLELVREQASAEVIAQSSLAAGRVAGAVLNSGVCHGDLHLGNVLCLADGSVSLIDFDKALVVRGLVRDYRKILESRWRRSVQRHGVGEIAAESFCRGLREVVP